MWWPEQLSFRGTATDLGFTRDQRLMTRKSAIADLRGREPGIQKQPHAVASGFRLSRRSLPSGRASRGPVGRSAGMTGKLTRLLAALALAGLTAGCFQPLYGDSAVVGTGKGGVGDKLNTVDVRPIVAPNGSRLARVAVETRNQLLYELTGGGTAGTSTYKLEIKLTARNQQVIVDIKTARPDVQDYGIDASYTLTDITNGKKVVTGTTFSRVSYNIPGQQQRFAGDRGLRDAENRAAKVIAENIRSRLASYFVAGT
jgi:LPS-assembly lipoprotein